jgi:hypothetical protein
MDDECDEEELSPSTSRVARVSDRRMAVNAGKRATRLIFISRVGCVYPLMLSVTLRSWMCIPNGVSNDMNIPRLALPPPPPVEKLPERHCHLYGIWMLPDAYRDSLACIHVAPSSLDATRLIESNVRGRAFREDQRIRGPEVDMCIL